LATAGTFAWVGAICALLPSKLRPADGCGHLPLPMPCCPSPHPPPPRQDDPYIAPTNTKLSVQTWSPCDSGSEWILVSTFNFNPDYPNPETPRLTFVDITRKVASALEKKGATKKFRAEWAYFVSYGSPIDRKYELWIPVSDEVISLLRSAA